MQKLFHIQRARVPILKVPALSHLLPFCECMLAHPSHSVIRRQDAPEDCQHFTACSGVSNV